MAQWETYGFHFSEGNVRHVSKDVLSKCEIKYQVKTSILTKGDFDEEVTLRPCMLFIDNATTAGFCR
ncbi:MAG: hypothetical protein MJA27_25300 [Pseudanabaenales cyanobacterium]|nr:hypothetical protein [Pseudanabaenales cyanobacterium]